MNSPAVCVKPVFCMIPDQRSSSDTVPDGIATFPQTLSQALLLQFREFPGRDPLIVFVESRAKTDSEPAGISI